MKFVFSLFCVVLVSTLFLHSVHAQAPASADAALSLVREHSGVPGIAAAVVRDGQIVALGTSGVRKLGQPEAVALGDLVLVASCTKLMTQLLVGRLVQDGRLRLEAKFPQLFPGVKMRPEYEQATLADLLGHTAGLPSYTRITPRDTPIIFELKGSGQQQREAFIAHLLLEPPAGQVGKHFSYSNAGFAALGNIVEQATGKSWEDLIQEQVFQPLGIRSATIGFAPGSASPSGHERTPGGYEPAKYAPPNTGVLSPAGGVCLTIEDFARFAAAEANMEAGRGTTFLNDAIAKNLAEIGSRNGPGGPSRIYFGGQGSFTAACAVWPASGVAIVVGTNAGDSDTVCVAAVEALRAAFAPDVPSALAGGPGSGPKLGVMLRAEAGGPVFIENVMPGGLADQLGIKAGDEIVTLNGTPVGNWDQNTFPAALRAPGAKLELKRNGLTIVISMPGGPPPATRASK